MSLDIHLDIHGIDGGFEEVYWANITHNLTSMAAEAGLYDAIWRPDEHSYEYAHQIVEPINKGLALLMSDPVKFSEFNAENGWGTYENFVPFVQKYLEACLEYPLAKVRVSR